MSNEELVCLIKNGESVRIPELWEQIKKLVTMLTARYLPRDGSNRIEMDDLLQAGFLATMEAVDDYDPASGYTFTTYLSNHLRNTCRDVVGIRTKKQAADPLNKSLSLDQPISAESENLTLGNMVQDHSMDYVYTDLIEEVARSQDCKKIFQEVDKLDSLEQEVFKDKFFYSRKEADIASRHGLKKHQVTNIITRSLGKIRRSGTVRLMSAEYRQDQQTSFYRNKGIKGFNTSFSSTVEDLVELRERLRQRMIEENLGGEVMG